MGADATGRAKAEPNRGIPFRVRTLHSPEIAIELGEAPTSTGSVRFRRPAEAVTSRS